MLAALAKGGAVLATGGILATGLVAVQRGHAYRARPHAPTDAGHASVRAEAAGHGTLLASVDVPPSAGPVHAGGADARRTSSWALLRPGSHRGRARATAPTATSPALTRGASSTPLQTVPVSSVLPRRGGLDHGEPHAPSSALAAPGLVVRGEDGRTTHRSQDGQAQGGVVSSEEDADSTTDRSSSGNGEASTVAQHDGNSGTGTGRSDGGGESSARVADSSPGSGDSTGGDRSHAPAEGSGTQSDGGAQGDGAQGGMRGGGAHGESLVSGSSEAEAGSQEGSDGEASPSQGS
jgi:hypothetical protein